MSKSEPALVLYYHPFASYCQKVLAALYESGTPFHPHLVDLGDEAARNAFYAIWPIGKFPVLRDPPRGVTIPESTTIIEYLDLHHPGAARLLPADAEDAWRVRARDRFFDSYIHEPMQKIVGDRLRPPGSKDAAGVDTARKTLATAYGLLEQELATAAWAHKDGFDLADCAAAPALFYADWVQPFRGAHPHLAAYFERLLARPSFARVVEEAKPYRGRFPKG